jgi:hypothetical protein
MLKYVSKLTMDILPSVVATIIGAYIVNHYIVTKPGADAPVAAAVSSADPKKSDAASTDVANIPAAGVRAKGISLKAIFDKPAAVKPVEKPPEKSAEKSQEPSEDKPMETASIPTDSKRQPPAPREKTAIRTIPLAVQPAASVVTPAAVPAAPAPTVEATVTPDDHRDANDLARAAIERLRGSNGSSPRVQETVRTPDAPRVVPAPQAPTVQASAPAIRPLPPPIMVSTPPVDSLGGSGPSPMQSSSAAAARIDDPRRPIPPADIPAARPLDLNAGSADPAVREHHNVAEDMLLAAKSVFHAVLPQ